MRFASFPFFFMLKPEHAARTVEHSNRPDLKLLSNGYSLCVNQTQEQYLRKVHEDTTCETILEIRECSRWSCKVYINAYCSRPAPRRPNPTNNLRFITPHSAPSVSLFLARLLDALVSKVLYRWLVVLRPLREMYYCSRITHKRALASGLGSSLLLSLLLCRDRQHRSCAS